MRVRNWGNTPAGDVLEDRRDVPVGVRKKQIKAERKLVGDARQAQRDASRILRIFGHATPVRRGE